MARNRGYVTVGPALAALTALLVLTGCSAQAGSAISPKPSIGLVPQLLNSANLRLPVEDYLPTNEQNDRLGVANLLLIKRCMARFGIDYSVTPVRGSDYGPVSLTDRRYGITDAGLARTVGYGLGARDPARQPKPVRPDIGPDGETVLSGSGRSIVDGQQVPDGGCIGEANRILNQAVPEKVDMRKGNILQLKSFEESKSDDRVKTAFVKWSDCMRESGYHYTDPLAAAGDPSFTPPASQEQIAVALADIACKEKVNLVGIWFTVDAAYEQREIDSDRAEFESIRAAIAAREKTVDSIIG